MQHSADLSSFSPLPRCRSPSGPNTRGPAQPRCVRCSAPRPNRSGFSRQLSPSARSETPPFPSNEPQQSTGDQATSYRDLPCLSSILHTNVQTRKHKDLMATCQHSAMVLDCLNNMQMRLAVELGCSCNTELRLAFGTARQGGCGPKGGCGETESISRSQPRPSLQQACPLRPRPPALPVP